MPASVDLDRDLRGWFAQGLAAPRDDAAFSALALRVFAAQYDALVKKEIETNSRIAKAANIKVN